MKNKLNWLLIMAVCLSVFGVKPQTVYAQDPQPVTQAVNKESPYVPGQMIVVFREGFNLDNQAETSRGIAESVSGRVLGIRDNAALLEVAEGIDIPSFTADFGANIQAKNPAIGDSLTKIVAYAQPNYIFDVPEPGEGTPGDYTPTVPLPDGNEEDAVVVELKKSKSSTILPTYPDDPFLYNTWGWWDTSTDVIWQDKSASPMICLLDTGVDGAHPDLAGKIVNGMDVVNNDKVPDDDNGHGTHVAGVMVAKSNNKIGISGVSNSKILAIKVMDSVGRGDSWNIAYGIRLCANNPAVKVINMSFGGGYDPYMYDALEYAIVTKGKLAIAAAGNYSTSDFSFPAAWAGEYVCADGAFYLDTVTQCRPPYSGYAYPNLISGGLISVGASRSYWSTSYDGYHGGSVDGYLWVDSNGGTQQGGELYYMSSCATSFSNYGAWISVVAPGENITSTVPVSYPYYQQYNPNLNADPDGDGYDEWSGTSMAAPFVTATAARVWSIGSSLFGTASTNILVKDRLISTGYSLTTAVDPNMNPTDWGYYASFNGEAPYCWPDATLLDPEFGYPLANMSNARVLNAADAMNRTTVYAYIYNALNNLPLKGATVGAYLGTAAKSQALMNSNVSSYAILPNLPRGKIYDIKVNKPGFTSGAVTISQLYIDPLDYAYISDPSLSVGIPPMGKIHGVLDWTIYSSSNELDLYSWIPEVSNPYGGGIIGYSLAVPKFEGSGRLLAYPYARWNIDSFYSEDWARTEAISITPRPGFPTTPYYNGTIYDYYDFIVHDYDPGAINENPVYFRLWVGGKIKATVQKTDYCDTDGADDTLYTADDERWWEPGYMWKDKFIVWDACGTGATYGNGGIWPYAIRTTNLPIKPTP